MISDDFWEWLKEYHADNTVPLQFKIAPNGAGYATVGSPVGCFKLSKREYNKLMKGE